MTWRGPLLVIVLAVTAGCASKPPAPVDNGSREVARSFCEALVRQDWPRAYTAVDPDQRAQLGPEQFTRLAQNYRAAWGFEPSACHVRSCEEKGSEAIAHLAITGTGPAGARRCKESVWLHNGPAGWAVVLPARFGHLPGR